TTSPASPNWRSPPASPTGTNRMQTPWGNLEVSDAHVHFFSHRFLQALGAQSGKEAREVADLAGWDFPGTTEELAHRWAAEFDRHGIARSSLIASVPG